MFYRLRTGSLTLFITLLLSLSLWLLISQDNMYQGAYYGKLYETALIRLTPGSQVKQEFVANYPGLNQVDVFIELLHPADTPEVTFQLGQSCQAPLALNHQLVRQPAGEVDGQTFYSFNFEPRAEPAGQKYCFSLSASEDNKDGVGIMSARENVYPQGQAYYEVLPSGATSDKANAAPAIAPQGFELFLPIVQAENLNSKNLDVAFRLRYDSDGFSTSQTFLERLVKDKPHWWSRKEFYVGLFILYIFCSITLIGLVINKKWSIPH